jgi:hypothetical protein
MGKGSSLLPAVFPLMVRIAFFSGGVGLLGQPYARKDAEETAAKLAEELAAKKAELVEEKAAAAASGAKPKDAKTKEEAVEKPPTAAELLPVELQKYSIITAFPWEPDTKCVAVCLLSTRPRIFVTVRIRHGSRSGGSSASPWSAAHHQSCICRGGRA